MLTNVICFVAGAVTMHFFPKIWDWSVAKYQALKSKVG